MLFLNHNQAENISLLILTVTAFYISQLPVCYATNLLILKLEKHLFLLFAILLWFFLQLKSALSHQNASKIYWSWKTLKCFNSSCAHKAYSTLSQKMRNFFTVPAKLPHLAGKKNLANEILTFFSDLIRAFKMLRWYVYIHLISYQLVLSKEIA